jgi:hypothetical protein
MKLVTVLLLFLMSCEQSNYTPSSKVDPQHKSTQEQVAIKARTYIQAIQYDEYNLALPVRDNEFIDQGDALLFNSLLLAAFCILQEPSAERLWDAYQQVQISDGRLVRHPSLAAGKEATSISKDGVVGFLFLGSILIDHGCAAQQQVYKQMLDKFVHYAVSHNYELGVGKTDPSVTLLTDRHVLRMVMKLYDLDHSVLDTKFSGHDIRYSAKIAPTVFRYNLHCKNGNAEACKIQMPGTFTIHLTFLSTSIALVDAKHNYNAQYSIPEVQEMLQQLASVGVEENVLNYLYLGKYWKETNQPVDDVFLFLLNNFPLLTSERQEVIGFGCTDYVWQRTPYESCNQSDTRYVGVDFLLAYALAL